MKTLVIIDDEMLVIDGIQAIIQRIRDDIKTVGWANDGLSGFDVLKKEKPDIIITDIRIPGTDGLSMLEAAMGFLPHSAVIVISGYQEFEYARKALQLGVIEYIDKPITIPKLQNALNRATAYLDARASHGLRDDDIAADNSAQAVQSLMAYIDEHYAQPLSLPRLAEKIGVTPAYLSVRFKDIAGVSFIKYLTNARMERSKLLLREDMKVAEVCQRVGYTNYRYFCELFRKNTGMTPTEYKRRERPGP